MKRMRIPKRILSLVLALVMVLGMMPHFALEAHAIYKTLNNFTVSISMGECKYCNEEHYAENLNIKAVNIQNGNVTIEFSSRFGSNTYCSRTLNYGKYNNTSDTSLPFTYSLTRPFSCVEDFRVWLMDVNFGDDKPLLSGSITRSKSSHNIHSWSSIGTNQHQGTCSVCGITVTENCTGDANANCTVQGTCTTCNGKYNTDSHSYTYTPNGNVLTETCLNGCGHETTATLEYDTTLPNYVGNGTYTYTGSEIKPLKVTTSSGWQGGELAISYSGSTTNVGDAMGVITATAQTDVKASLTYKITEADISEADVIVRPSQVTYGQTAEAGSAEIFVKWNGDTLTIDKDYKVEWDKTPYNSGVGTYTATITGIGNFTGTTSGSTVVESAMLTNVSVSQTGTLIYDGESKTPTVTTTATTVDGSQVTFAYSKVPGDVYGEMPSFTDAGTYTVYYKASAPNHEDYKGSFTVTIAPTDGSATVSIEGWEYGDTAKTPVPVSTTNGTDNVTYQYKVKGADDSTYTSAVPTAVGEYTVKATFAATQNYKAVTATDDFAISKRTVTVTADDASKTYGGAEPELTWSVTSGTELASEPLAISISRADGENTGDYTITVSQTEGANPNYNITFVNGTFTIEPAKLTITANSTGITYGDAVPTYTVTYSGFAGSENKDVLDGTLAFACDYKQFSDATTYEITPSGLTSGNYDITFVPGTLTVKPKAITVTIDNKTSVYGKEIVELTATDDGIVGGDENVYSLATTATKTSNVGTYAITGTTVDSNYNITFVNGTYTVTYATNQWTTEPAITDWTYSETASTPSGAAKFGNVTVTYAKKGTETFTSDVPTQAGDYTAKFTVEATGNYNGLTETVDFTIAKKPVTVTEVAATGREYDGTKTVAITEVTLDGVKEGDAVTVDITDLTGTLASADKGTYTVVTLPDLTLSAGTGNYALTQPTAPVKTDVEITAKPITVTVEDITNQTWTGSALTPAEIAPDGLVAETDEYCTVTYTDNTNVGKATVKVEAKGNYSFETIEKTFLIVPDESLLDGLTTANVTSADKTNVDKAVEMMKNADMDDAPEEDKEAWAALENQANALQERIEAADAADETQNIQDAEDINAGNVKLDQKQDLEDALKDLEAAKDTYSGNYTQAEKNALDAEIKRIEDALAAIERVGDFNTAIDDSLLAEDVKTDMDADTELAIKDAQAAYNALSDHEKTLVDPADKTKLDTLVATITAYKITKGDGGRYTVGSGKTLSFTANGPVRKFDYVQVNGKTIAASNYTVTEGSTVITLKSSYLDKLGYGKHKIQIFYTDGSTDVANFRIYVNGGNPFTGDNSHMMLFGGVAMVSLLCMAMMVMFISRKKGKYQR